MFRMFFIVTAVFMFNLHAEDTTFFKNGGEASQANKAYLDDPEFVKGMNYLYSRDLMLKHSRNFADPEGPKGAIEKRDIYLPDYKNAFGSFLKSFKKGKNTIAAYQALYLLETKFPKRAGEWKYFKDLAEHLYNKEKKICQSYLYFGSVFQNGIYNKVEPKRAILIYSEAIDKNVCKGYQEQILIAKIIALQNKLKKAK